MLPTALLLLGLPLQSTEPAVAPGLDQATPRILGKESIEKHLDHLGEMSRPARYEATVEKVTVDPRHEVGEWLLDMAKTPIWELTLAEIEEAATLLLDQAQEDRPASYHLYLVQITWTRWRQVVRYVPEYLGLPTLSDWVQEEDRCARFQPKGAYLRFSRGRRPSEPALIPELFPESVLSDDRRQALSSHSAWTERSDRTGRRLLEILGKDSKLQLLFEPDETVPRARRVGRVLEIFDHAPGSDFPVSVLRLDLVGSGIRMQRVRIKDYTRDFPPSDLILEIGTPQHIAIPSSETEGQLGQLPDEWKGLVVVSGDSR